MSKDEKSVSPDHMAACPKRQLLSKLSIKKLEELIELELNEIAELYLNYISIALRDAFCELEKLPILPKDMKDPIKKYSVELLIKQTLALNKRLQIKHEVFTA